MSQENVEIARQSLTVAPHSRRRLEERLGLRFPGVLALVDRLVWRLPPRSRLRRAAFGRAARLALEAHNRGDFEAAVARYDSQVELISDSRLVQLGYDRVYRGRDERVRFQQRWVAEWGDFQFEPRELVYLGNDRAFMAGRIVGSGLSSGAAVDSDWAVIVTLGAGRVIREQFFFDHDAALEAAGLRE